MTEPTPRAVVEGKAEGWNDPYSVSVFGGCLLAGVALTYHILSLQWLRAPGWKNKPEAHSELKRLVAEYSSWSYQDWAQHIDQKKSIEFTSDSGTWYQAQVRPFWDGKPNETIRVNFSIDDGGVGAFHPLTDSILIDPPSGEPSSEQQGV